MAKRDDEWRVILVACRKPWLARFPGRTRGQRQASAGLILQQRTAERETLEARVRELEAELARRR